MLRFSFDRKKNRGRIMLCVCPSSSVCRRNGFRVIILVIDDRSCRHNGFRVIILVIDDRSCRSNGFRVIILVIDD